MYFYAFSALRSSAAKHDASNVVHSSGSIFIWACDIFFLRVVPINVTWIQCPMKHFGKGHFKVEFWKTGVKIFPRFFAIVNLHKFCSVPQLHLCKTSYSLPSPGLATLMRRRGGGGWQLRLPDQLGPGCQPLCFTHARWTSTTQQLLKLSRPPMIPPQHRGERDRTDVLLSSLVWFTLCPFTLDLMDQGWFLHWLVSEASHQVNLDFDSY